MSLFSVERSNTAPTNIYDHAINLVDSTKPDPQVDAPVQHTSRTHTVPDSTSERPVTHQVTKSHLRKELARRKYAKWQEEKEPDVSHVEASSVENGVEKDVKKPIQKSDTSLSGRLRDRIPFRSRKKPARKSQGHETFIDVLYENQRGWWLCGIPLYSSNSLLQIDPAAWQTSIFTDSAVNITNAQVPDPSWQWDWRRWYVDMSYDVDEEGWQYSFAFGSQFAWHGNHPWFHSYVRRRRWLRKRVMKDADRMLNKRGNLNDAHRLNPDYFSIHPSPRETSVDRTTAHQSSFTDAYNTASETDEDLQDIGDIAALLATLKKCIVDREKIVAVKTFLDQGGDELYYLEETMTTILNDLVHESSRRQLQLELLQALDAAIRASENNEQDEEKQHRVKNLRKAIHVSGVQEKDTYHSSSLRSQAIGDDAGSISEGKDLDATETVDSSEGAPSPPSRDSGRNNITDEIRGLSDDAGIFEEPHIGAVGATEDKEDNTIDPSKTLEKGKGRA